MSSGQQLEIAVSGQIDMWPQGPGQYTSGPGGLAGYAPGGPPGGPGAARVGAPGQVVARVGPNGTPFVVGAAFKAKAADAGRLYLRIVPSPWNNDSSGAYKVKVTTD